MPDPLTPAFIATDADIDLDLTEPAALAEVDLVLPEGDGAELDLDLSEADPVVTTPAIFAPR